jgi:hypothetical protein
MIIAWDHHNAHLTPLRAIEDGRDLLSDKGLDLRREEGVGGGVIPSERNVGVMAEEVGVGA